MSDSSRYGYELRIKVSPEVEPDGPVRILEFRGGLYAVARCQVLGQPELRIPACWGRLADWCRANDHPLGYHQALEKFITSADKIEQLVLDLYCPIAR
ncbi:MAG: GyrI-like domain-containing protein [Chloroflexi bacterium]|nr:GyrI-like domain-containing protein [Chloroflexota bacterium]